MFTRLALVVEPIFLRGNFLLLSCIHRLVCARLSTTFQSTCFVLTDFRLQAKTIAELYVPASSGGSVLKTSLSATPRVFVLLIASLVFRFSAIGQDPSAGNSGGTPSGAYLQGSEIDNVQLNNGNLTIKIPLSATLGRGFSTGQFLIYNSKGYYMSELCTGSTCNFFVKHSRNNQLIPSIVSNPGIGVGLGTYQTSCDGGVTNIFIDNGFSVVEPDGTSHHMVPDPQGSWGCQIPLTTTRYADDGSGWILMPGNPNKVYRKDGTVNEAIDTNGNQLSYSIQNNGNGTFTLITNDTLGRALQPGYYDSNGFLRTPTITTVPVSAATHLCFTPSSPSRCTEDAELLGNAPSQLTLPNGLSYSFQYTGSDVTSLTLPTGAVITYTYTTLTGDYSGSRVASRTVTVNGQVAKWTYTYAGPSTQAGDVYTTTVIDPLNNQTVYTCVPMGPSTMPPLNVLASSPSCQITDVSYFIGTSTLLKTVHTDYWAGLGSVPKAVTTTTYSSIAGDSSVTKTRVESDYDGQIMNFPGEQDYISRGNVIEQREFIYDSAGNNPQLVRKADYVYLNQTDSRYDALNISNRVTDKIVYDCTGGQCTAPGIVGPFGTPYTGGIRIAETQNSYDSTPLLNANGSATAVTVPGHDDANFGVTNTLRGNLTQARTWLNSTNTFLSTTNSYDVLGHLINTTDPGSHITTFSYSDDWNGWGANVACLPPSNSYAFLTDTTNAKGQHNHSSYFPCTGQAQAVKDQNDINNGRNGTSFTYDLMNRTLSKSASDGGSTSYSYNDSLIDLSMTETEKITASLNRVVKTNYDGLGRSNRTALLSDPDGVTNTDVAYDLLGRKSTLSNPYRNTTESTYGLTTYIYDALGRNTMVVPPDGSTSFNNASVAFGGNYTITKDQAGNQRKRFFDPLGRIIEVDEPGALASGGSVSTGSFTISSPFGGDQSHQQPGAFAAGTVQVGGTVVQVKKCGGRPVQCNFITDTGSLNIVVAGAGSSSGGYGGTSDTASTIATQLANGFSTNPNISASASGGTVTLKARAAGPNYTFTTSQNWDRADFTNPQITIGPASGNISGGVAPSFSYDAGQVKISIGGYSATVNYDQNSTTSLLAIALAGILNGDTLSPVSASLSGSTINLTSKAIGTAANYTLSGSSVSTQFSFTSPSFNATPSGSTMVNGANVVNLFDSPFVTLYTYDMRNDLIRVEQRGNTTDSSQWRIRTFQYDSLGHLTQSNNPETGTINFGYDGEGKLATRTSPLPNQIGAATVTTTYAFDQLHRHTGRSFSNGDSAITYVYDAPDGSIVNGLTIHNGIGQQTGMIDASGSTAWTYDLEGRIVTEAKTIGTVSKSITYGYNFDGSAATIRYPSGNTITYTPSQSGANSAGRVGMVQDIANNINYVTGASGPGTYATYAPDGSIASFENGYAAGFTGIANGFSYNGRLQPVFIQASSPSATIFNIGYDFHLANGNNGNVYQLTNNKDNSRSKIFTYDQLNRVTSGKTSASNSWGTSYILDAWGNLTQKSGIAGMLSGENFSQAAFSNNRLTGFSYDAAGNVTADGINSYLYNAESQVISTDGIAYVYDGSGNRVQKSSGRIYWFGLSESDANGIISADYIFSIGGRIARRDLPSGTVHFYFTDRLKSTSVVSNAQGNIEEESDYTPWGEEKVITHTLGDQHYKFNGKERDPETGLDEFGARLYSSAWGRWLTPDWSSDPVPIPYGQIDAPQSFNLYSYVSNNPTTLSDVDGHMEGLGNAGSFSFSQEGTHHTSCSTEPRPPCADIAKAHEEFEKFKATCQSVACRLGMKTAEINKKLDTHLGRWYQALDNVLYMLEPCHPPISCGVAFPVGSLSFDALAETGEIDAGAVRFSQDSIRRTFTDGRSVAELAEGLKNGTIDPASVPPIRILEKNGQIFSLDNRRLAAYQEAGIPIRYQKATFKDLVNSLARDKFSTGNGGTSIRVRGEE
jgi:RHS repeat-associated protein